MPRYYEVMPPEFPRHIDRTAKLCNLSAMVDPNTRVVSLQAFASRTKKRTKSKERQVRQILRGFNVGQKERFVGDYDIDFNGFDKKHKRIETTLSHKDVGDLIKEVGYPEMVTDGEAALRKMPKNCPFCDKFGLDMYLSYEVSQCPTGVKWAGPVVTPSEFVSSALIDNGYSFNDYPRTDLRNLRGVEMMWAFDGVSDGKIVPWKSFIKPGLRGIPATTKIQSSWVTDWYHDMAQIAIVCGESFQSTLFGMTISAAPKEKDENEAASEATA